MGRTYLSAMLLSVYVGKDDDGHYLFKGHGVFIGERYKIIKLINCHDANVNVLVEGEQYICHVTAIQIIDDVLNAQLNKVKTLGHLDGVTFGKPIVDDNVEAV